MVEICSREDAWCMEEFEDVEAESSCNDGGFGDAGLVGFVKREDFSRF